MSQLSKILGAFSVGHTLTHGGKDYTFGPVTQKVKDALNKAYYKRAREAVYQLKEELDETEYRRMLDRVTDEWTSGKFNFPAGPSFNYFLSLDGIPEFLSILLGVPLDEARTLVEQRSVELMHLALCVVTESFPDFRRRLLDMERAGRLKNLEAVTALFPGPSETPC